MKYSNFKYLGFTAGALVIAFGITNASVSAVATRPGVGSSTTTTSPATSTDTAARNQAKVKLIISRGDKEINRRLKTLNTLSIHINGAKKLSSTNKATLSNEVKVEIDGLTSLKQKLDADTDLATAQADAQSIFSGYRVYALIVPKVQLVKTADDQQVAEERLLTLSSKLQTRITDAKKKGKDVSSLQATLDDMIAKAKSAQTASSSVESSVISLQPSDYNANRAVLSGQRDKLKAAQNDIKTATANAKTIVSGLSKP